MSQKPAGELQTAVKIPRSGIQGPGFASRRVSGVLPKTPVKRSTPSVGGSTKSGISSARSISASVSASQGQASKPTSNPIRSRVASMIPMTRVRSMGTPPKSPASLSHSLSRSQAADAGRPVASPTQTVIPNDTLKTTPRDKENLMPLGLPINRVSPTPRPRSTEHSSFAVVTLNQRLSASPVARAKQTIEMTPRQGLGAKTRSSPRTTQSSQAGVIPKGQSSNPFLVDASSAGKSLTSTSLSTNGAYSVSSSDNNTTDHTFISDLDSLARQTRQIPRTPAPDESESAWAQSVREFNRMAPSRAGGYGDEDVTFDMISDAEQLDEDVSSLLLGLM